MAPVLDGITQSNDSRPFPKPWQTHLEETNVFFKRQSEVSKKSWLYGVTKPEESGEIKGKFMVQGRPLLVINVVISPP